jgi:hypothetical protein
MAVDRPKIGRDEGLGEVETRDLDRPDEFANSIRASEQKIGVRALGLSSAR